MKDRLARSILLTTLFYFLLQGAIYLAFSLPAKASLIGIPDGFALRYGPAFFATSTAFHLFLLALLFVFKADFVKESTGELLERVNLANRITMFRITTLPTLLFLVVAARDYRIRPALLVLVVVVFATDFLDGYVSRKGGEVTKVGRMMDSASDYSLLIVLTIAFSYFRLIPVWFFALVLVRLGLQMLLVSVLMLVRRRIEPRTTIMGKVAVAGVMVLYAAEVLRLLAGLRAEAVFLGLEVAVGLALVAGMIDKIVVFARDLKAPVPAKAGAAAVAPQDPASAP